MYVGWAFPVAKPEARVWVGGGNICQGSEHRKHPEGGAGRGDSEGACTRSVDEQGQPWAVGATLTGDPGRRCKAWLRVEGQGDWGVYSPASMSRRLRATGCWVAPTLVAVGPQVLWSRCCVWTWSVPWSREWGAGRVCVHTPLGTLYSAC